MPSLSVFVEKVETDTVSIELGMIFKAREERILRGVFRRFSPFLGSGFWLGRALSVEDFGLAFTSRTGKGVACAA